MLTQSRRLPAEHFASDASFSRARSRSLAGPIAVPLGSAYSEPRHVRPPHRRSASTHHRDPAYERDYELARSHSRHGSVGRHPEFPNVVPANIATAGSNSSHHSRGREQSRSRVSSSSSHRDTSAHSMTRPNAVRRSTWQGPPSGTTFAPSLKIHRQLASNNGSPAILYDVTRAPSHDNILAPPPTSLLASLTRRSRAPPQPVPAHTLALPATRPFVPSLRLSLPASSSSMPVPLPRDWVINAVSIGTTDPAHTALTNLDVLHAVYSTLREPVSRREWDALGSGSNAQRRIAEAYSKRCERSGRQSEWDAGVRRVDYLCGRTMMCGIECRPDGMCELVFTKAHA
ncbi:uncharacterized protein FOMMEDRAFT_17022 [Fomitiporia mediterranea MF3/22]|uniref:uncharacterized protein n=1 Tax=Fomitiporia mediterranea (strain MF3/22) TaxID=694068 RepID=UPI0004407FBE|nr:uncharacterized protein FOMMEDRAFT_17022 [Fomitiporia mediterranea MF3/22]EJD06469.1 hypothetical protein FOMMEDRAFT_17022 [Fomitiporia mediterranea MF3/22]